MKGAISRSRHDNAAAPDLGDGFEVVFALEAVDASDGSSSSTAAAGPHDSRGPSNQGRL